MRRFAPYYKHLMAVRWPFLLGVLAGLVNAAASGLGLPLMMKLVFPIIFHDPVAPKWYLKWALDLMQKLPEHRLVLAACLWIPMIFVVRGISGYLNAYLIHYSGLRVAEEIRADLFARLQQLPLAFFKQNRSGDLLARLTADTEILRQVVAQASSDLIKQPATLLFSLSSLVILSIGKGNTFISLIALLTIPLCIWPIQQAGKRLAKRAQSLQAKGGDLTASLSESLQSPLEIRAYNLQDRQNTLFRQQIRLLLKLQMKVVKYRQVIAPVIEFVAALGLAIALYIGAGKAMKYDDFMALGAALFMAYEPIKKIGNIHSLFKQGEAAEERLRFILEAPDTIPDPPSPVSCLPPTASIHFDRVSFAYGDESVLHDVSVHIPIGSVVALIGPSGAGKTTFANLIPRFYDPASGAVRFDGTDLRDFRKHDLRSHIAVVPQMPTLFMGTIADNIRIGKLDASDDEIVLAARRAHADTFIRTLPDGYQTSVGERGDQLSGGQRQRIAIARAFLRDSPVLILDEATSALDSESETLVQNALAELVKGRTTFIIAHRFSTIAVANRILVFQHGRITADGTHEQLLAAHNPFYLAMRGGSA